MLEIFYDGDCPICSSQIAWIKSKSSNIILTDIHSPEFFPELYDMDKEDFLGELHADLNSQELLRGFNVVLAIYDELGYKKRAWFLRLPIINKMAGKLFDVMSRHRYWLSKVLY